MFVSVLEYFFIWKSHTEMPNKKAELIEGVVYVASPLRFRSHGQPHGQLITWLGVYQVFTPGVALGDNATVRLDLDNEPQPDVLLLIDKPAKGQAQIDKDDYIEGAPELVAEVAASSASIDLYDKKRAYRRNGVQEYIVWKTLENKLDWFCLQNGEYLPLVADADGVIKSRVFPGLWLAVTSLITGDMTTVLAVLQQRLNSKEHTEFIEHLAD
ncbi:MAG: Uma2 family endonuclease [Nostoc sp.]